MAECIFCAIAGKQVPAKVVYEDEETLSFLDINPRSTGMCVVIPKQHYQEFDENFELSNHVLQTAMTVAEMIKQSLQPKAIDFAIMPSETVPHFHVRVYPVNEGETPLIENQPKQASEEELNALCSKISSARVAVNFPVREVVVEKEVREKEPKEKKAKGRSKKAVYWMRREMEVG